MDDALEAAYLAADALLDDPVSLMAAAWAMKPSTVVDVMVD